MNVLDLMFGFIAGPHDCAGLELRGLSGLQQVTVILWPAVHLVYAA